MEVWFNPPSLLPASSRPKPDEETVAVANNPDEETSSAVNNPDEETSSAVNNPEEENASIANDPDEETASTVHNPDKEIASAANNPDSDAEDVGFETMFDTDSSIADDDEVIPALKEQSGPEQDPGSSVSQFLEKEETVFLDPNPEVQHPNPSGQKFHFSPGRSASTIEGTLILLPSFDCCLFVVIYKFLPSFRYGHYGTS